ncbi:MAG TPA: CBS domain-containing protein [Candidatus Polarisedimenticolaceae bacterium]|nr:CBS domain-containing protein [Candidatus Polarisedimenticolaceae bacterium]
MAYVASDIMSRDVFCVDKSADLRDLAKLFLARKITGAPVIDGRGDLCGVISQTDLLFYQLSRDDELAVPSDFYSNTKVEGRSLTTGFQIEDVNTATVEEVMTPVVHSVTPQASVDQIARLMTRRHIHRVIVREGRKAVGIISALDILRVVGGGGANRKKAVARVPKAAKAKPKKAAPKRARAVARKRRRAA